MKVLHICSYYIGSQLYRNLIINLDKLGIENNVYIPIISKAFINKYSEGEFKKASFIYSNSFNKIDRFFFKIKSNKIYQDLLNKVNLDEIDILHAHSLFTNGYIAYMLKKEIGKDYIVAVRNTDVNIFFKYMPWMRKIGINILKNAKKVIFISKSYKDNTIEKYVPCKYKQMIKSKSSVIPNGVDRFWLDNFNENIMKKDNKNKTTIIYVGQLNKNKNIISTIIAIDNLINLGYKIEFNIIGEGKYSNKINKLANENRSYIKLYGYKEKEELLNLYRNSDIFVMPSKKETFGLVYVEALTQGLPVIYTKYQGFDGYFNEGEVGFSVNSKDICDISNKIKLLIDSKLDISNHYKRIEKDFDWYTISKKYIDIYNK